MANAPGIDMKTATAEAYVLFAYIKEGLCFPEPKRKPEYDEALSTLAKDYALKDHKKFAEGSVNL